MNILEEKPSLVATCRNAKASVFRSYQGFSSKADGDLGWLQELARQGYLRKLNDGDLLMIQGASTAETESALRSCVLGFVKIEAQPVRDRDKASYPELRKIRVRGGQTDRTLATPSAAHGAPGRK